MRVAIQQRGLRPSHRWPKLQNVCRAAAAPHQHHHFFFRPWAFDAACCRRHPFPRRPPHSPAQPRRLRRPLQHRRRQHLQTRPRFLPRRLKWLVGRGKITGDRRHDKRNMV